MAVIPSYVSLPICYTEPSELCVTTTLNVGQKTDSGEGRVINLSN